MNLFKAMWDKTSEKNTLENIPIYAPASGQIATLESLKDGVFSESLLGPGCVINSQAQQVYAPCNGTIVMVASTKHAIGIMSDQGVEVMLHIGLDTVNMDGDGFDIRVIKDEHVTTGQLLMTFSKEKIKNAGYSDEVIMIVTNSKKFSNIVCVNQKTIKEQEEILYIEK